MPDIDPLGVVVAGSVLVGATAVVIKIVKK